MSAATFVHKESLDKVLQFAAAVTGSPAYRRGERFEAAELLTKVVRTFGGERELRNSTEQEKVAIAFYDEVLEDPQTPFPVLMRAANGLTETLTVSAVSERMAVARAKRDIQYDDKHPLGGMSPPSEVNMYTVAEHKNFDTLPEAEDYVSNNPEKELFIYGAHDPERDTAASDPPPSDPPQ